jgi:hypothetical protein
VALRQWQRMDMSSSRGKDNWMNKAVDSVDLQRER